jgi:hypothetical protein
MFRPASRLVASIARVRTATSILAITTTLSASLTACSSDSLVAPQQGNGMMVQPLPAASGSITGVISLAPGIAVSLGNARVAIYTSVADRRADRVVRQTALPNTGPNYAFTLTDVAPGTYYLDVCFIGATQISCLNPSPDNPITVIAGRSSTINIQVR